MEIPDIQLRDGLIAGVLAGATWIWQRINGDIKVSKALARRAIEENLSKKDFERYLEHSDAARREFLTLFEKHVEKDNEKFTEIQASLAVLEERSKHRRSSDS